MIFAKWSTQAPICKYQSIGNLLICNKSCRPFWNARRNYLFRSEKVLCYSSGNFQQVARCFVSKIWTAPTPRLVETMVGRRREANYGATSRTPPAPPPSPIFVKKQGVAPGGSGWLRQEGKAEANYMEDGSFDLQIRSELWLSADHHTSLPIHCAALHCTSLPMHCQSWSHSGWRLQCTVHSA